MRPVRSMAIAAVLTVALTACGANDSSNSSTSTDGTEGGTTSSVSAPKDNTTLEAPQPPADKWSARGDLCNILTNEMATDILGQPVKQFPAAPNDNPRVVDECHYSYDDGDKIYVANVLVLSEGNEVVKMAEQFAGANKFEITEYHVGGFDRAFYVNYEANVLDDNMLVAVNNGATGKFDPAALVEFAALVHKTVSNR